jgi:hypothetical protein
MWDIDLRSGGGGGDGRIMLELLKGDAVEAVAVTAFAHASGYDSPR